MAVTKGNHPKWLCNIYQTYIIPIHTYILPRVISDEWSLLICSDFSSGFSLNSPAMGGIPMEPPWKWCWLMTSSGFYRLFKVKDAGDITHTYLYTCIYIYICCKQLHIYVCTVYNYWIYIYTVYKCTYICIYIYIHVCMYVM